MLKGYIDRFSDEAKTQEKNPSENNSATNARPRRRQSRRSVSSRGSRDSRGLGVRRRSSRSIESFANLFGSEIDTSGNSSTFDDSNTINNSHRPGKRESKSSSKILSSTSTDLATITDENMLHHQQQEKQLHHRQPSPHPPLPPTEAELRRGSGSSLLDGLIKRRSSFLTDENLDGSGRSESFIEGIMKRRPSRRKSNNNNNADMEKTADMEDFLKEIEKTTSKKNAEIEINSALSELEAKSIGTDASHHFLDEDEKDDLLGEEEEEQQQMKKIPNNNTEEVVTADVLDMSQIDLNYYEEETEEENEKVQESEDDHNDAKESDVEEEATLNILEEHEALSENPLLSEAEVKSDVKDEEENLNEKEKEEILLNQEELNLNHDSEQEQIMFQSEPLIEEEQNETEHLKQLESSLILDEDLMLNDDDNNDIEIVQKNQDKEQNEIRELSSSEEGPTTEIDDKIDEIGHGSSSRALYESMKEHSISKDEERKNFYHNYLSMKNDDDESNLENEFLFQLDSDDDDDDDDDDNNLKSGLSLFPSKHENDIDDFLFQSFRLQKKPLSKDTTNHERKTGIKLERYYEFPKQGKKLQLHVYNYYKPDQNTKRKTGKWHSTKKLGGMPNNCSATTYSSFIKNLWLEKNKHHVQSWTLEGQNYVINKHQKPRFILSSCGKLPLIRRKNKCRLPGRKRKKQSRTAEKFHPSVISFQQQQILTNKNTYESPINHKKVLQHILSKIGQVGKQKRKSDGENMYLDKQLSLERYENSLLKKEIQKLKFNLSEQKKIQEEKTQLEKKVESLHEKNQQLEENITQLYEAKERLKECFTKKLEVAQMEQESDLLESQAMHVALNEKIEKLGSIFEDQVETLNNKNKELEEKVKHFETYAEADQVELNVLKQQVKFLQKERAKLLGRVVKLKKAVVEHDKLKQNKKNLEVKVSNLALKNKELEMDMEYLNKIKSKVEDLAVKRVTLNHNEKENFRINSQIKVINCEMSVLKLETADMKRKNEEMNSTLNQYNEIKENLFNENKRLQSEIEALKTKHIKENNTTSKLYQNNDFSTEETKEEIEKMKKALKDATEKELDLEEEFNGLELELWNNKKSYDQMEKTYEDAKSKWGKRVHAAENQVK